MTRWFYLARFFAVVPPMPLLMIGAFVVVTVASTGVVVLEPTRTDGALTPVLLLQLFATSSGFDVPARRGHYDLLLTHGEARRRIIIGHWAASAFPGVISWLVLGVVSRTTMSGDERSPLFTIGTLTAVCLVSTIPWATTVRLPRFSGAIGWLLIVATMSLIVPGMLVLDEGRPGGLEPWLQDAWAVLVYPPLLVGRRLDGADGLLVVPALTFAAAALTVAFVSVSRRDIPLEAAQ
jgi:hypothetical protein